MKNSPNYVALEFNFAYLRESHSFLRDYCNRIKGDFHSYCQIMFKEKGSDGMLLIQQVSEKFNSCDYVRCPSCKSGRLCDKTLGVQIRAVPITDSSLNKDDPGIILKCPKCGKKFEIRLDKKYIVCT